ncbi:hypothetical protein GXW78_06085 [Roseomonas terrae]|uniref:TubC N-terminal docking domain-containing protein n=1 Tax=Neoroseomonas terrae TaxID=424799 RepID=A0ABS5EDX8_9PROT|nr:hypothetical protein [Neoroseomonas terrae]MBR0649223.1 hypothetical protein [Neoroseomonas terrae]
MSAAAIIARAQAEGVRLWVEGEQVRVRAARPPAPDLLAALRAQRDDVLRLLTANAAPPPPRDAWGLTDAEKADGAARVLGTAAPAPPPPPTEPAPMDHDAGERAAMVAHYGAAAPSAYRPDRPDELRDGLSRGFHAHRHVWSSLPFGAERRGAFDEARRQPGACPTCASHRWWHLKDEPATALRCSTCHPPDHLETDDVEIITT